MIRLAVTTRAETYHRLTTVLPARGIDVKYLQVDERIVELSPRNPPWDVDTVDLGYVYPSRLMEGGVADALLSIPWINDRDAVLQSRNKAGVVAAASDAGLPTPDTIFVSNPVDEDALVDAYRQIDGPVVIKPNSTTRGLGVARADDVDSLLGIVDYLNLLHDFDATGDKSYLLQEFIPNARDVRVMVVDGAYAGAVERARIDDTMEHWKHNVHRGGTANGVEVTETERELAEAVADLLDIPLLGVDLLITEEGPILSETNARPTIDDLKKYESNFLDRFVDLIESLVE